MRASIRRYATIAVACVALAVSGAVPGTAQASPGCVRQVDIADAKPVSEGNSTTTVTFTVSTNTCQVAGSVKFETADGDGVGAGAAAQAGSDYLATSGSLTWLATDSAPKQFDVTVLGDVGPEPVEYFRALLSSGSEGLVVVDGSGLATINDDDDGVFSPIVIVAPAYGCWQLSDKCTIDVTLSFAVTSTVTVRFDTRDGTALAGRDYVGVTGGWVIFRAGTTRAQVTIPLLSHPASDPERTFSIIFYEPSFGTIGTDTADVTIHRG